MVRTRPGVAVRLAVLRPVRVPKRLQCTACTPSRRVRVKAVRAPADRTVQTRLRVDANVAVGGYGHARVRIDVRHEFAMRVKAVQVPVRYSVRAWGSPYDPRASGQNASPHENGSDLHPQHGSKPSTRPALRTPEPIPAAVPRQLSVPVRPVVRGPAGTHGANHIRPGIDRDSVRDASPYCSHPPRVRRTRGKHACAGGGPIALRRT